MLPGTKSDMVPRCSLLCHCSHPWASERWPWDPYSNKWTGGLVVVCRWKALAWVHKLVNAAVTVLPQFLPKRPDSTSNSLGMSESCYKHCSEDHHWTAVDAQLLSKIVNRSGATAKPARSVI